MRSAHRPPTRQTLPPPDQGNGGTVITLDQVRPYPRQQNEYVDSPRGQPLGSLKSPGPGHVVPGGITSRDTLSRIALPSRTGRRPLNSAVVTQPPVSISPPLKKEPVVDVEDDSIICNKCKKCRCGDCTEPRELPSRWLCGNRCHVSPNAVLEKCTCFCVVKGVFYHCGKDEQDADYECYTDPCACCSKPHCCSRWTCMAFSSLCLPCLCCYWPARGVLKACTVCYNKCRMKGCQCAAKNSAKSKSGKKSGDEPINSSQSRRLLLFESDSSSSS